MFHLGKSNKYGYLCAPLNSRKTKTRFLGLLQQALPGGMFFQHVASKGRQEKSFVSQLRSHKTGDLYIVIAFCFYLIYSQSFLVGWGIFS